MKLEQIAAIIRKDPKLYTKDDQREEARTMKGDYTIKSIMEEIRRQEAISNVRRERRHIPHYAGIVGRCHARLTKIGRNQIRERSLSTPTGWTTTAKPHVIDYQPKNRLWIIGDEYRYHYSNRFGDWWVGAHYLCGKDDGQYFALRIPVTCEKVSDALVWITPTSVLKAQQAGRWSARQGDVWLVELKTGKDNLRDLPVRHNYNTESRCLEHPEHRTIQVPDGVKSVRAYRQTQLASSGRRGAD